jgi:hypothetical protein
MCATQILSLIIIFLILSGLLWPSLWFYSMFIFLFFLVNERGLGPLCLFYFIWLFTAQYSISCRITGFTALNIKKKYMKYFPQTRCRE